MYKFKNGTREVYLTQRFIKIQQVYQKKVTAKGPIIDTRQDELEEDRIDAGGRVQVARPVFTHSTFIEMIQHFSRAR